MVREIKKMFYFLYFYFKLFGHVTLGCKIINKGQSNSFSLIFSYSKIGIIYNFLLIILLNAASITRHYLYRSTYTSKTVRYVQISFLLSTFGTTFILLKLSFKQKDFVSIIKKFNLINRNLIVDPVIVKNFYVVILAVIIQILRTYFLVWKSLSRESISKVGFVVFQDLWINTIINSTLVQISFLLQLVESCIIYINNELLDILRCNQDLCHIRPVKNWIMHLRIRKYSDLFGFLSELSQEISHYYSLPLLIIISIIFTLTLIFLYLFLQFLIGEDAFNESSFFEILILIYPLLWLTIRVSVVLNEVCKFYIIF